MESAQEFYDRVANASRRLGASRFPPWYRGQASTEFRLLPGLLRRPGGEVHERNLFAEFRTMGARIAGLKGSSWEWLALMQHYGMPTRLLDWTHSMHTALFFATLGPIRSPVLWILNPYELNSRSTGRRIVFDAADEVDFEYFDALTTKKWAHQFPIALEAPWTNDRVLAQRGCFTFHCADKRPLDDVCKSAVKGLPIPPHLVREIRSDLKKSGVDHFRLFPDLDGLSQTLREKFRF